MDAELKIAANGIPPSPTDRCNLHPHQNEVFPLLSRLPPPIAALHQVTDIFRKRPGWLKFKGIGSAENRGALPSPQLLELARFLVKYRENDISPGAETATKRPCQDNFASMESRKQFRVFADPAKHAGRRNEMKRAKCDRQFPANNRKELIFYERSECWRSLPETRRQR